MTSKEEHIRQVVDEISGDWEADSSIIFGTEQQRKKLLHASRNRRFKGWKRSGTCVYPGCTQASIPKSHTLQRNGPLALIAENGHVVAPAIGPDGTIRVGKVGINLASTFAGFCEEHEQIFTDFEEVGEISQEQHVAKQAFRTVCREIAIRKFSMEEGEKDLAAYHETRARFFRDRLQAAIPGAELKSVSIEGDTREEEPLRILKQAREMIIELSSLKARLADIIEGRKAQADILAWNLPLEIPVALSGALLPMYRKRSEKIRTAPIAVGVIPQNGRTVVYLSSLSNHRQFLIGWYNKFKFGLSGLNLIEQWMVHGTDHWYLPPSLWASLTQTRQTEIEQLIQSEEFAVDVDPAPSIFDNLRLLMLRELEGQQNTENRSRVDQIVAEERAKLPQ
ncbi:hypothetical protein ACIGGE_13615 [Qipengyuania sp. NPDC077410]|uniref:hypothetical protein n=1 Tax=Qipengyuania sp. NPDC077410 TaxID=3364496 RepID=UPI0037C7736A